MGTGRTQGANTATALSRRPDPSSTHRLQLPDILPATFSFNLTSTRPTSTPSVRPKGVTASVPKTTSLDPYLQSFSWSDDSDSTAPSTDDSSSKYGGEMLLNLPDPADPASIDIGRGYLVTCNVQWGDRPFKVWELQCDHPTYNEGNGTLDITFGDELAILKRGVENWVFRQSKHHPRAWRTNEIIAAVCDHLGVPHRILYQGKPMVKNFRHKLNAYEVIQRMHVLETSRQLIFRMIDGTLEVLPYKVNPLLFGLSEQLEALEFMEASNTLLPYTAVIGLGRYGKNKKSPVHRTKHPVTDPALIKVYGYRPYVYHAGVVDGYSDLVAKSRVKLAQLIRVRRTATVTVPGLPFVRKGDMIELEKPQLGLTGDKALLLVGSVQHTVSSGAEGGYSTDLKLFQKDPYKTYRDAQDKKARAKAKAKRKKK